MKKRIVFLMHLITFLIGVLLPSAPVPAEEMPNTWTIVTDLPAYEVMCKIAPYEDGAWLAADDFVYRYDLTQNKLIEYSQYEGVERIAAVSECLVLYTSTGFYWIGFDGEVRLHIPPYEGMGISQIERCGNDLLVLLRVEDERNHESDSLAELLLLSNMDGSEKKRISIPYSAERVATDEQGTAYLPTTDEHGTQFFLKIDVLNGVIEKMASLNYYAEYIAASSDGRLLYFLMDDYVYAFDTISESIRNTGVQAMDLTGIRRGGDALYSGNYEDNALVMMAAPSIQMANREIRVVNPGSETIALHELYRGFEQRYPDVEIKISYMGSEHIVTSLMSGNDDIDVLFWETEQNPTLETLAKSDCLLNLGSIPELVSAYDGWIPMEQLLCYKDQWVAVPTIVWPRAFFVNTELAASLGIDIPTGEWDFERFYQIAKEVNEKSNGEAYVLEEYGPLHYLEEFLYANCIDVANQTAAFNQEECLRLLEIWIECLNSGYVRQSANTMDIQEIGSAGRFPNALFVSTVDYFNRSGDAWVIQPPVSGEMRGNPSYMQCMTANSRSQNRDIIIDFLQLHASDDVQTSSAYSLSEVFLLDADKYPKPLLFGRIDEEAKVRISSANNKAVWIDLLSNGVRRQSSRDIPRWEFYDALMLGDISIEDYLNKMQSAADMVLGE